MNKLEILGLSKQYGDELALDEVSLAVAEGEFVTVLGRSGSGKTTLLRSIAGFIKPTAGNIRVAGRSVLDVPVNKRGIGVVFQNYALFPHLTVRQNVAYGLRLRRIPKHEIRERVEAQLDRVQLAKYADRTPAQLSGGQQQRVAVARALILEPEVMLFDEPFSNLDVRLRESLRNELGQMHDRLGFTALFVTHDQREALSLADRVAVMDQGRLVQFATPQTIYNQPASSAVATMLGRTNLFTGRVAGSNIIEVEGQRLTIETSAPLGAEVSVMVRPHRLRLVSAEGAARGPAGEFHAAGTVRSIEYHGATEAVLVDTDGRELLLERPAEESTERTLDYGTRVDVRIPHSAFQVLESHPKQ